MIQNDFSEDLIEESKEHRHRLTMGARGGSNRRITEVKINLSPEEHEVNLLVAGFWEGVLTPSEKESLKKIIGTVEGRERILATLNKRRGLSKINKKGFLILGEIMHHFLDKNH